jgi:hypothetical protein
MCLRSLLNSPMCRLARLLIFAAPCLLGGCISSTEPILGDAKAILGERIDMHIFNTRDDALHSEGVSVMQWTGSRYVQQGGAAHTDDFTVHAFEGRDLIIQTAPRPPRPVEYALARRLAPGTYLIAPIDEQAADEATRERFCTKTEQAPCRVMMPEQVFVFARAMGEAIESAGVYSIVVITPSGQR